MNASEILCQRFRLDRQLGEGGLARVFLATDLQSNTKVAIKLLLPALIQDPFAQQELQRDLRVSRMVSHPGILRVYDLYETDDVRFLVSEYFPSESLDKFTNRYPGRRLPPSEACRIAVGVAEVIMALHAVGVHHGDIKPGNVLVGEFGSIKLIDFGIAVLPGERERPAQAMAATAGYAAKEQLSGCLPSASSDAYSFGCLLVALLTGSPPESDAWRRAVVSSARQLPPESVKLIEQIIASCLRENPTERPRDLVRIAQELEAAFVASPTVVIKAPRLIERLWMIGGVWAVVVLLAVVFFTQYSERSDRAEDSGELTESVSAVGADVGDINLDLELQRARQLLALGRRQDVESLLLSLSVLFPDSLEIESFRNRLDREPPATRQIARTFPTEESTSVSRVPAPSFPDRESQASGSSSPQSSQSSAPSNQGAEPSEDLARAESLFREKQYAEAEQNAQGLLQQGRTALEAGRYDEAAILAGRGQAMVDTQAARDLLQRIQRAKDLDARNLFQQARTALEAGRYDEAAMLAGRSQAVVDTPVVRDLLQRIQRVKELDARLTRKPG